MYALGWSLGGDGWKWWRRLFAWNRRRFGRNVVLFSIALFGRTVWMNNFGGGRYHLKKYIMYKGFMSC